MHSARLEHSLPQPGQLPPWPAEAFIQQSHEFFSAHSEATPCLLSEDTFGAKKKPKRALRDEAETGGNRALAPVIPSPSLEQPGFPSGVGHTAAPNGEHREASAIRLQGPACGRCFHWPKKNRND